jgi:hypothetical protein
MATLNRQIWGDEEETTTGSRKVLAWRGAVGAMSGNEGGPAPQAVASRPAPQTMASGPQPNGLPPSHRARSREALEHHRAHHWRGRLCPAEALVSDEVGTQGRRGRRGG